jgi:hypothetical protein
VPSPVPSSTTTLQGVTAKSNTRWAGHLTPAISHDHTQPYHTGSLTPASSQGPLERGCSGSFSCPASHPGKQGAQLRVLAPTRQGLQRLRGAAAPVAFDFHARMMRARGCFC